MKSLFLSVTLLLAMTACGGGSSSPAPAPVVVAPTITSFTSTGTSNPDGHFSVTYGHTATLSWTLGGGEATSINIQPSGCALTMNQSASGDSRGLYPDGTPIPVPGPIKAIKLNGGATSMEVTPQNRQDFTLTVTNAAGSATKTVTVSSIGVNLYTTYQLGGGAAYQLIGFDGTEDALIYGDGANFESMTTTGTIATLGSSLMNPGTFAVNPVDHMYYFAGGDGLYTWNPSTNASVIVNSFFTFYNVTCMRFDNAGNLYIAVWAPFAPSAIYKVTAPYTSHTAIAQESDGISGPIGLAIDSTGNIFVANAYGAASSITVHGLAAVTAPSYGTISKITPEGTISTIAGVSLAAGYLDGPAAQAHFNIIQGIALDSTGTNLYICDGDNSLVRKLNLQTSIVNTVAGTQFSQWAGAFGGPNQTQAPGALGLGNSTIGFPTSVLVDVNGNLLVTTARNNDLQTHVQPGQLYQVTLN